MVMSFEAFESWRKAMLDSDFLINDKPNKYIYVFVWERQIVGYINATHLTESQKNFLGSRAELVDYKAYQKLSNEGFVENYELHRAIEKSFKE